MEYNLNSIFSSFTDFFFGNFMSFMDGKYHILVCDYTMNFRSLYKINKSLTWKVEIFCVINIYIGICYYVDVTRISMAFEILPGNP